MQYVPTLSVKANHRGINIFLKGVKHCNPTQQSKAAILQRGDIYFPLLLLFVCKKKSKDKEKKNQHLPQAALLRFSRKCPEEPPPTIVDITVKVHFNL